VIPIKILFVCTDNFTRSIIAEYCLKDLVKKREINEITVSSAGMRANSDVSKYSKLHFDILQEMNISTNGWKRTQFTEEYFDEFDLIIGMSEVHKEYIKEEYNREIPMFNEILKGESKPVNIGAPNSKFFEKEMKELVHYFIDAMPELIKNINTKNEMWG
jgi:protein-tyrosine phosphatase